MPDLGALILAAGGSTRMGQPKQLLEIQGQTLIRRTVEMALATGAQPVVVVLGNAFEGVRSEIADLDIQIVFNPDWQKGMTTSFLLGYTTVLQSAIQPDALMMLLCDQPFVSTDILKKLYEAYQKSKQKAIACEYAGVKGVPAIFDLQLLSRFNAVAGDFGARHLIKSLDQEQQLAVFPFPEGAIDLDTPEDYERFLNT